MDQHRAIGVVEDVAAHFNDTVRPDADQVPVERRVVELAQRHTVGHHRGAEGAMAREVLLAPLPTTSNCPSRWGQERRGPNAGDTAEIVELAGFSLAGRQGFEPR
jgi:hypothetical protein